MGRGGSPCCSKKGPNKGPWSAVEDKILTDYIKAHGEGRWGEVPKQAAGLNRCGRSCRLRWLNYLRPDIKRGNISHEEEDLIIRLHKLLGNRWSLIAGRLPGRTDNEIKNYWNTVLKKKVQARSVPLPNDEERKSRSKTTTVQAGPARCIEADTSLNQNGDENVHEKGLKAPVIQDLAPGSSLLAPQENDPSNLSTGFSDDSLFLPCFLDFEFFQPLGGGIQQDIVDCKSKLCLTFDDSPFEHWIGTDHNQPYGSPDLGSMATLFESQS